MRQKLLTKQNQSSMIYKINKHNKDSHEA